MNSVVARNVGRLALSLNGSGNSYGGSLSAYYLYIYKPCLDRQYHDMYSWIFSLDDTPFVIPHLVYICLNNSHT
jgi:hypothetical protein